MMSKDILWDLFTRARAARLVAREAWDAKITCLNPPENYQADYWRKLAEADKITENVLNIIREEIER